MSFLQAVPPADRQKVDNSNAFCLTIIDTLTRNMTDNYESGSVGVLIKHHVHEEVTPSPVILEGQSLLHIMM